MGKDVPTKKAKQSMLAKKAQEEPEGPVSMAQPGAGAAQTYGNNGLEEHGTVNNIEPFDNAYKDGFMELQCVKDLMYSRADKFGARGKYAYGKHATTVNVSIVHYNEIVFKDAWEAMTPQVCYEFCQTIPDMGFFGISKADDCYCTPYVRPVRLQTEGHCDLPCPGDATVMCGGEEKSSLYEMHLCMDTARELTDAATAADKASVWFYESAFLAHHIGINLQASGNVLYNVGLGAGDTVPRETGDEARIYAGKVGHLVFLSGCLEHFQKLWMVYEDAKDVRSLDFFKAENIQKADL